MSIDELLMFVYDELDLMALCAAMQDAPQRCANMRMMLTLAKRFPPADFADCTASAAGSGSLPSAAETWVRHRPATP